MDIKELENKINSLNTSSNRLLRLLKVSVKDDVWQRVLQKEAWINFKRSYEVLKQVTGEEDTEEEDKENGINFD